MTAAALADAVARGERRAIARAVTLIESTRGDHRAEAAALLDHLAPLGRQAIRIGLTGPPGVGKSTLVETLGLMLVDRGLRLAVLAVDPSSARSGGSILGDKTRMERLVRHPGAFVRPSPAAAELGGVARRTREAAALMEGAGFDVVLIETVGVGQSETLVAEMTDLMVLLVAPAGGDELQGVKRGIVEMADLLLVTKADGDLEAQARRTCADYAGALRLMRPREGDAAGGPVAMAISALGGAGLEAAWDAMRRVHDRRRESGALARRRGAQARAWFDDEVRRALLARAMADSALRARLDTLRRDVEAGRAAPTAAARAALDPGADPSLDGSDREA